MNRFEVIAECPQTKARAGILHTAHGDIETPVFMPVGTQATVKALSPHELSDMGAQIILSNTYHLHLRPGSELVREAGGLHEFMRWPKPILTDSGGFQVFSLAAARKMGEEGVEFQSHIDGSRHMFTPERAVEIQHNLGADIIMAFDECVPYPAERQYTQDSMHRTHRWAERCKAAHQGSEEQAAGQMLFGIVQGGMEDDLRRESAQYINGMDLPGNAIGGLSVGEPKPMMYDMLDVCVPELDAGKPRYLMGVGSEDCLMEGVKRGVDMFDCVMQTRMGRTAAALLPGGRMNLRNNKYTHDFSPIMEGCGCYACAGGFTRAYIRHLFMAKEIMAARLVSIHNIYFTLQLMREARQAIIDGCFVEYAAARLSLYDD